MTKILFVDDDAIARRSMISKIKWNLYGWELMYTAKDAIDALDYIENHQPDIIICDIQMPVMDGIQMAVIIKNYYPEIKFIFLSGFKEFEYAKQAIKLNAVDYINKPIDDIQLIEVIKSAEKLYYKEVEQNKILKEKYPFVKRQYISKLLYENFQEIDESTFKAFDINITNGYGVVGFIDYSNYASETDLNDFITILSSKLTEQNSGSFFLGMESQQIFVIYTLNNIKSEIDFHVHLKQLEIEVENYSQNYHPEFHYGSTMKNINELYKSYQNLLLDINSDTYVLLQKVKRYINENYSNPDLSLTMIASYFNVNHCYLTSIFKNQYQIALYDYLIQTRMQKAGELSKTTDMKVYEIADAVGYKNSQYFSISFKKYFNCTVSQYKDN